MLLKILFSGTVKLYGKLQRNRAFELLHIFGWAVKQISIIIRE